MTIAEIANIIMDVFDDGGGNSAFEDGVHEAATKIKAVLDAEPRPVPEGEITQADVDR